MSMHELLWENYKEAALKARKQGHLARSSRIIREALRESEEYGELVPSLVSFAHDLAEMYLDQCKYTEAEILCRAVLELREKLLGPTHEDVVQSLRKLAVIQIMSFRAEALGTRVAQRYSAATELPFAAAS